MHHLYPTTQGHVRSEIDNFKNEANAPASHSNLGRHFSGALNVRRCQADHKAGACGAMRTRLAAKAEVPF